MNLLTPSMPGPEAQRQIILKDIHAKWGKLSDAELSGLKSRDGLVAQVVAKYDQETSLAQRDVDALLRGRTI